MQTPQTPIYLDYMATTPVDPFVAEKMRHCLEQSGIFGNCASQTHRFGWEAMEQVDHARHQVAELVNVDPKEITWTSGATESDNLAIKGAALFYQRKGKHIITMSTEHPAVLDTCRYLASQGFEITYLEPQPNGVLDLQKLRDAIRSDTILVSIMHVNNETGVIQDVAEIGKITREEGVLLHVDAAQSAGKLHIDLQKMNVDLMSFSGHKIYGPKGIGALYVRRKPRVRLEPQIHGGGHERGLRSGTLPTHQIVGIGEAFALAQVCMQADQQRIAALRDRFWKGISEIGDCYLNGDEKQRIAGCMNVRFDGVESESLLLSLRDLAVSSGSACSSASHRASHVLTALGLSEEEANRAIRFSLGRFTTEQEIDFAITHVIEQVKRLRSLSPLWQKTQRNVLKKS